MAGGNAFTGDQTVAGNTTLTGNLSVTGGKSTLSVAANGYASLNVPATAVANAPSAAVVGDLWLLSTGDKHLQFIDPSNTAQQIAYLTDITNGTAQTANQLTATTQCLSGYATGIQPNGTAVCATDGSALINLNAANLVGIVPAVNLSGLYTIDINGTATTITGNIADTQVTGLTAELTERQRRRKPPMLRY